MLSRKETFSSHRGHLTIHDFIDLPFRTYGFTGFKLFAWNPQDLMTRWQKVLLAFHVLNLMWNFGTKMSFVLFWRFEDTIQVTALICFLGFASNGVCKVGTVWLGRRILRNVIVHMNETFPMTEDERLEYRVQEHFVFIKRSMRIMFVCHWAVALMFICFPMLQSTGEWLIGWREDGEFVYRFPYIMLYPFDENRPLTFAFAYSSQFMGGVTVSCFFLGSDLLLVATVHLLNMQFGYLSRRIEKFQSTHREHDMKEISAILEYHSRILNFSESINNVFNFSLLLNYMFSVLVICLIGFQVVAGSGFLDLFKFVAFLGSSMMHVYFVCFFGNNLITLSEKVCESFCSHAWYSADLQYQRMLPLAIARSQRPAHLTAFKFFIISMESFSRLITTSYQFFTLIKTRYDEMNNA